MKFKLTANRKQKYIRIDNVRFFTFTLTELPKEFASVESDRSIKKWFNYKGYTLVSEFYLSETITQR